VKVIPDNLIEKTGENTNEDKTVDRALTAAYVATCVLVTDKVQYRNTSNTSQCPGGGR